MSLVVYLGVVVTSLLALGETVRWFASRAEERRWQLTRNSFSVASAQPARPVHGSVNRPT
jgi:hypothetical protein